MVGNFRSSGNVLVIVHLFKFDSSLSCTGVFLLLASKTPVTFDCIERNAVFHIPPGESVKVCLFGNVH